ncbi:MAG TPA: hypothetical protein V6D15_20150 [Oculatellaceae cyanobacterium]|jgi:transposase-like protein
MSPRKLSESDKQEILTLYRQLPETTSTLASRYGVSSSTISRLLKTNLSEQEYEGLIQQKRTTRTPSISSEVIPEVTEKPVEPEPEPKVSVSAPILRRLRRRSSAASTSLDMFEVTEVEATEPALEARVASDNINNKFFDSKIADEKPASIYNEMVEGSAQAEVHALEEMIREDISDLDDEEEDLQDLDDEDWEDDPDDDDTEEITDQQQLGSFITEFRDNNIQVLPLSQAHLPKICYLVVDKAAELIARPLRDFSDLGRIPAGEVQQKTLPVFDNHRVARRFSNRTQRVIKIPDSRMLQKACSHLQAKGITRLLIHGQVYSLL